MECATRVAPEVMLACSKTQFKSAARDSILILLRGVVGERPCPSKS
jgi:hypothetical protein